jgi:predicted MFS family arabinose efflux permease
MMLYEHLTRPSLFQVAAIGFIVGVTIMASAWTYWVLMFGRVFVGLGVGFGLAVRTWVLALMLSYLIKTHLSLYR